MSENEQHKARLEQAVGRLEEALSLVMKKAEEGAEAALQAAGERDSLAEQVHNLTQENESLRNQLATAQQQHDDLRRTTDAVSERLDTTIMGLKKLLDA